MNVYFISGLGADFHAFDRIEIPSFCVKHDLPWLEPLPSEALNNYAKRMAEGIDLSRPFVLVGLSFGGIVAIEIHQQFPALQVILISSISNRNELPWYFRFAGSVGLHQSPILPLIKKWDKAMYWFFGTRSARLKGYLKERMDQTTLTYLKWSLNAIVHWKQAEKPNGVIHLHGSKDKLFPIQYCCPDYIVQGGSHFMVVTHAREISRQFSVMLGMYQDHS
ncbi:MAG: alpha/beta hydrolase [Chitinophagaceae bacterium]